MIEVTQYYPAKNTDFLKNPLVEAWPPLNAGHISALMLSDVQFSDTERSHSADLRLQYVHRLMNFFLPLDSQAEFAQKLWTLICTGYQARSPVTSCNTDAFNSLCASIKRDAIPPSTLGHFRDSMWSAFLIGTPGAGKTSTALALLRRLSNDLMHHSRYGQLYQCLYIHVQAPKRGGGKAIAELIFGRLMEEAAKAGLPLPYARTKPKTLAAFEEAIRLLVKKLNLGILILDELQHLYAGTGKMDEEAMKFLTGVVNRLEIPVLFIGTWECMALLGLETRLSRRVTSPVTAFFKRMDYDENFTIFVKALMRFQFTEKPVEVDTEMIRIIYFHTQGIQDLVIKLVVMCQVEAILTCEEEITADLIETVGSNHMAVISPAVRMLREGRKEDDPDLWDLEPTDFKQYVKEFTANLRVKGARHRRTVIMAAQAKIPGVGVAHAKKAADAVRAVVTEGEVAASLEATGTFCPEDAIALSEASVSRFPGLSAAEHVQKILASTAPKGPKPTRSAKPSVQTKTDRLFNELDDKDVRKVVYLATRGKVSVSTALEEAGLLCALAADAPY